MATQADLLQRLFYLSETGTELSNYYYQIGKLLRIQYTPVGGTASSLFLKSIDVTRTNNAKAVPMMAGRTPGETNTEVLSSGGSGGGGSSGSGGVTFLTPNIDPDVIGIDMPHKTITLSGPVLKDDTTWLDFIKEAIQNTMNKAMDPYGEMFTNANPILESITIATSTNEITWSLSFIADSYYYRSLPSTLTHTFDVEVIDDVKRKIKWFDTNLMIKDAILPGKDSNLKFYMVDCNLSWNFTIERFFGLEGAVDNVPMYHPTMLEHTYTINGISPIVWDTYNVKEQLIEGVSQFVSDNIAGWMTPQYFAFDNYEFSLFINNRTTTIEPIDLENDIIIPKDVADSYRSTAINNQCKVSVDPNQPAKLTIVGFRTYGYG